MHTAHPFATFAVTGLTLAEPQPVPFDPTAKDPLLTLADSAAELGISFRALKQIIKAGGLKPDKTLGRIRLSQVRAYGK